VKVDLLGRKLFSLSERRASVCETFLKGVFVLAEGTVKWFSEKKGYGFIQEEGAGDLFVHHSAIDMPGFKTLNEGERVTFDVEETARGRSAKNVRRL
jgi:CspA family cold shock protein